MRIIITGATGSLGAVLTRYFGQEGHDVIATGKAKVPPKKLLNFARYIEADVTQPYELPEADVCIHTAAFSDDKGAYKDLYPANVTGTKNTVRAAANCRTFIHISSSSVYLPSAVPLTESVAGKQNNSQLSPYGLSKLKAEEILRESTSNPSVFILRPRAHYGPGDKVILPRMLKLVKNGAITRPGSMEVKISLTHYDNLIRGIESCIKADKSGIHTYNISDDRSYQFIDIIRKMTQKLYGKTLPEKQIPIVLLKLMALFKMNGITPLLVRSFTKDMVLDISKIKNELAYTSETDFYSALPALDNWVESIGGVDEILTGNKLLAWC